MCSSTSLNQPSIKYLHVQVTNFVFVFNLFMCILVLDHVGVVQGFLAAQYLFGTILVELFCVFLQ